MSFPKTQKGLQQHMASRKKEWEEMHPGSDKKFNPYHRAHPITNKRELAKFAKVKPLTTGYFSKALREAKK